MIGRKIGSMLLLTPILVVSGMVVSEEGVSASSSAAPGYLKGSRGAEIVTKGETPVKVTSETLTFYIDSLPEEVYQEMPSSFGSTLSAEYALENASDSDAALTLYFPLGSKADYLPELPDSSLCTVTADGASVPTQTRYTYLPDSVNSIYGSTYDVVSEIPSDDFDEQTYRRDTEVHLYRYRVSLPDDASLSSAPAFIFEYSCNPRLTQIVNLSGGDNRVSNGKGYSVSYVNGDEETEIVLCAIGKMPRSVSVSVRRNGSLDSETIEGVQIERLPVQSLLFGEWMDALHAQSSYAQTICDVDWYNIIVDILKDEDNLYYLPVTPDREQLLKSVLVSWCEYQLIIPAQGELIHTVTVPIYPGVMTCNNARWGFEYYLSPAQCWAEYDNILINIQTSYRLESCSLDFTECDGGYTFAMEGLPMGELTFTLMKEKPQGSYTLIDGINSIDTIVVILLCVAGGVVVVTIAIIIWNSKRTKKKNEERQRRLDGMHARQGKVDIDAQTYHDEEQ